MLFRKLTLLIVSACEKYCSFLNGAHIILNNYEMFVLDGGVVSKILFFNKSTDAALIDFFSSIRLLPIEIKKRNRITVLLDKENGIIYKFSDKESSREVLNNYYALNNVVELEVPKPRFLLENKNKNKMLSAEEYPEFK